MSTDTFGDELRTLLRQAADAEEPAYLDVDPGVVVFQGRRVVRRRRIAAGAGIAAVAVTVGLVGISPLGDDVRRSESVPGSRTTAPAAPAAGTVSVDLANSADAAPEGGAPQGRPAVRVTVDRTTRRVEYLVKGASGFVPRGQGMLPVATRAATWLGRQQVDGVVVGVLPAAATDLVLLWAGDAPGATHTTVAIPGTEYQAFAVWGAGIAPESVFAGLDWTDGSRVYAGDGSALPSARLGDLVAFVDEEQNLFGLFGDGTSSTKRLSDTPTGAVPVLMQGVQPEGSTTMEASVLVVLPAGARDVTVTPRAGATVRSTDVAGGGTTGPTLAVARLELPQAVPGTGVKRVSWTGADGRAASTRGASPKSAGKKLAAPSVTRAALTEVGLAL